MTEVNWYGDKVALLLEGIAEDGLLRAAYQIEAEAKIGAAVDTGFMRNTIFVHSERSSTFQARSERIDGRLYESTDAPPPAEPGAVYVGVGANYAIYVEIDQPFLYPALMRVASLLAGIIQSEARGRL